LIGAVIFNGGKGMVLWKGVVFKVVIPMILSPLIGFLLGFLLMKCIAYLMRFPNMKKNVNVFNRLQIASASCVALAHGLNDAQKSMGIITLGLFAGGYLAQPTIPLWVILSCAVMMGLGTASGGFRIIRTVGFEITKLQPFHGFAAETSSSIVILAASFLGMPVSSTHMIVGSVTGVGSAKRPARVHWETAKKVMWTWAMTLPGSAIFAGIATKILSLCGLH
jgi:PiT family inorganic phosphate transporter